PKMTAKSSIFESVKSPYASSRSRGRSSRGSFLIFIEIFVKSVQEGNGDFCAQDDLVFFVFFIQNISFAPQSCDKRIFALRDSHVYHFAPLFKRAHHHLSKLIKAYLLCCRNRNGFRIANPQIVDHLFVRATVDFI